MAKTTNIKASTTSFKMSNMTACIPTLSSCTSAVDDNDDDDNWEDESDQDPADDLERAAELQLAVRPGFQRLPSAEDVLAKQQKRLRHIYGAPPHPVSLPHGTPHKPTETGKFNARPPLKRLPSADDVLAKRQTRLRHIYDGEPETPSPSSARGTPNKAQETGDLTAGVHLTENTRLLHGHWGSIILGAYRRRSPQSRLDDGREFLFHWIETHEDHHDDMRRCRLLVVPAPGEWKNSRRGKVASD